MTRATILTLAVAALMLVAVPSAAHRPGSDGGPADRGCGVLRGVSSFGPVGVGATRVSCRIARKVARASVRESRRFARWRCTGRGTRFGHCHGRGARRGAIVHWNAFH